MNAEQLKANIQNHQKGKSDYFQISRQCADNGIQKWAVCLISMTCAYIDKAGNKAWVAQVTDLSNQDKMFTVEQIKGAHSKEKSGADFPKYIQEIKAMGVTAFETWVKDSHSEYFGTNDYRTSLTPMYKDVVIADSSDKTKFEHYLKMHQRGETNYSTFCEHCAETGIDKWFVSLDKMTCTYYVKRETKFWLNKYC